METAANRLCCAIAEQRLTQQMRSPVFWGMEND